MAGAHGHAWVEGLLLDMAHGQGLARTTLKLVRHELHAWMRWLHQRGGCVESATADDARAWLDEMTTQLAGVTVDKKLWAIRRLYRWAMHAGVASADPWQHIARARRPLPWAPRFTPSRTQVQRLLAMPDTCTPEGIRDRAMLELLYASGLRAAELLALDVHQIIQGRAQRSILVMGKGAMERLVLYASATDT